MRSVRAFALLLPLFCLPAHATEPASADVPGRESLPSIAETTAGLEVMDGFLPLAWDEAEGRLWMVVPSTGTDFLYVHSLAVGIGSNVIGLDRN